MKTPYLCAYHTVRMRSNESEALRAWSALMQRGVRAYVECRVEASNIYLSAAMDIAFLRLGLNNNAAFSHTHLLKPAEFIVQLFLVDNAFDSARNLLKKIEILSQTNSNLDSSETDAFLESQYTTVEMAENDFFGFKQESNTYKNRYQTQNSIAVCH